MREWLDASWLACIRTIMSIKEFQMQPMNRAECRKAAHEARSRRVASSTSKRMGRAAKQLIIAQGEHKLAVFWSRAI